MPPLYFDKKSGELVDIESNDIVNKTAQVAGELIVATDIMLDPAQEIVKGSYVIPPRNSWEQQAVVDIAQKLVRDLAELDPPRVLTRDLVQKLYLTGTFPRSAYFLKANGIYEGIDDFRKKIGANDVIYDVRGDATRNDPYRNLTANELAALILDNYDSLFERDKDEPPFDGPITKSVIKTLNRMSLAPAELFIIENFGGLRELNEILGFPNIHAWDTHDYIAYGAEFIRYNGWEKLTPKNMQIISKMNLGPVYITIHNRFRWQRFKSLALEEYEKQLAVEGNHRSAVLQYWEHRNPQPTSDATFEQMARHRALWILTGHYRTNGSAPIPEKPTKKSAKLIIEKISKYRNIATAKIETEADILGISHDLWPVESRFRPPILPDSQ